MKTKGHQQIERENVWTNFLSPPTLRSEYISFCRTNPPKQSQTSTCKRESRYYIGIKVRIFFLYYVGIKVRIFFAKELHHFLNLCRAGLSEACGQLTSVISKDPELRAYCICDIVTL